MDNLPLFDWMPPDGPRDGTTFNPWRDEARLNRQQQLVWRAIKDGQWHTLADIAAETGCPEASVSARLRDFRKPKFGGLNIEREYVTEGLWRYRLKIAAPASNVVSFAPRQQERTSQ